MKRLAGFAAMLLLACGDDAGGTDSAASNSASASTDGGGEPFPCGDALMCESAAEYCQRTVGGAKGNPSQYVCIVLPAACAPAPSCDCLTDVPCGLVCDMSGAGELVTCPAP